MGLMKIGDKYYVSFKWKGHRIRTVSPATNSTDAKKIEKAVKTAFTIGSFGHLDPDCLDVVLRTYENKGWALPPELARPEPTEELTLIRATREYLKADPKHRSERNLYAIDRITEHFGEQYPLKDMKVAQIRKYQVARQKKVENSTINREVSVLSGIMRNQVELGHLEFNPCLMARRLPANQRDSYLSWKDFNSLLKHSWWLHDVLVMLYYTGMRFNEVVNLRWEMYKPERRMLILPPDTTKEGKNPNKLRLRPKRVPLRKEVVELLESLRRKRGGNVVQAVGKIFSYTGRFKNSEKMYHGMDIDHSTVRKCWARAIKLAEVPGLQMRDLRHTWKTNAQRSGMDPTVRNLIVGHSTERSVADRYIRVSDEELLRAVDSMSFDHGWTELDLVEDTEEKLDEKGAKKVPKGQSKRKIRVQRSIATL
ncbi:tyrosine-type recombinase/integrase [Desulfomonile tiedjei]|uniref:Site-specific recombinase XerD n=1 Tax=Desulfomonile tiedjei (strain ATCC 49306 / DSM 6799 / DCB-1) TaxID=706587 RepID=I4C5P1_DESTA|nr:tyrosine-type recombinase/integrase [Desulfomonile tiedjei]AFM24882.1 site-specific recombinase XerD [Desulfomonile tiedjei DSM 6799]